MCVQMKVQQNTAVVIRTSICRVKLCNGLNKLSPASHRCLITPFIYHWVNDGCACAHTTERDTLSRKMQSAIDVSKVAFAEHVQRADLTTLIMKNSCAPSAV